MDKRNYFEQAFALFLALAAAIAFYFILYRFGAIRRFFTSMTDALEPVILGAAAAYILRPVAAYLEQQIRRVKGVRRFARLISVLLTVAVTLGIIALFCSIVLPQLIDSISSLSASLPSMIKEQSARITEWLDTNTPVTNTVSEMITNAEKSFSEWMRTSLLSTISNLAGQVISIGSAVIELVIALIVTIYLLLDRERYLAQCRKLFLAVSKRKTVNRAIAETLRQADRIFSGFISGKVIDSIIIGIICFFGMLILRLPYAALISVIVGVTNVIPMFGPYIGAIPSAFLLLLVSPKYCLVFLIFIIVLQQVDGNIIGPRILGNSTGLSALYVVVAMLIFGKLFGLVGMIIGVPVFATCYYIVKRLAERSLRKQGLPTDTAAYSNRITEETKLPDKESPEKTDPAEKQIP